MFCFSTFNFFAREIISLDMFPLQHQQWTLDSLFLSTKYAEVNMHDTFLQTFGINPVNILLDQLSLHATRRKADSEFRLVLCGTWRGFERAPLTIGSKKLKCFLSLNKFLASMTPLQKTVVRVGGKLHIQVPNFDGEITIPVKLRIYDFKQDLVLYLNVNHVVLPKSINFEHLSQLFDIKPWMTQHLVPQTQEQIILNRITFECGTNMHINPSGYELKLPTTTTYSTQPVHLKNVMLNSYNACSVTGMSGQLEWEIYQSAVVEDSWVCKLVSASAPFDVLYTELRQLKGLKPHLPYMMQHLSTLQVNKFSFYMVVTENVLVADEGLNFSIHVPPQSNTILPIPYFNCKALCTELRAQTNGEFNCMLQYKYTPNDKQNIMLSSSKADKVVLNGLSKGYLVSSVESFLAGHSLKLAQPVVWAQNMFCITVIEFNLNNQQFVIQGSVMTKDAAKDQLPQKNRFELVLHHGQVHCSMKDLVNQVFIPIRFAHWTIEMMSKIHKVRAFTDLQVHLQK